MPTRRVMLESTRNYYVALAWVDDHTLRLAEADVSDSFDQGQAVDIPTPMRLLEWLATDRFSSSERMLAYCSARGIAVEADPDPGVPPVDRAYLSDNDPILTVSESTIHVHDGPWGEPVPAYLIEDWQALLLFLVEDRCEGNGAWDNVQHLLRQAGIEGTPNQQVYI